MRCVNPACRATADQLFKGTLRLVEFESTPDDRVLYPDSGFPVCAARTRYFWLCETCSSMFTIRGWNSSGVILERLRETVSPGSAARIQPAAQDAPERVYVAA